MKLENTKSLTRFELRSCIVGSTANEFIIIAFCYERAGLVAVDLTNGDCNNPCSVLHNCRTTSVRNSCPRWRLASSFYRT